MCRSFSPGDQSLSSFGSSGKKQRYHRRVNVQCCMSGLATQKHMLHTHTIISHVQNQRYHIFPSRSVFAVHVCLGRANLLRNFDTTGKMAWTVRRGEHRIPSAQSLRFERFPVQIWYAKLVVHSVCRWTGRATYAPTRYARNNLFVKW